MTINVHASGIDMTDAINAYAIEKMESLSKYFDNIVKIDISVGLISQHHQKGKVFFAEANVAVPKKSLCIKKEAENLYKAIDKVRDHYKVEFEKIKGKMRENDKELIREQKAYHVEDED